MVHDAQRLANQRADGITALQHALEDGEDFELILAVPAAESRRMLTDRPLDVQLTDIGYFVEEPGLWQTDSRSGKKELLPRGWEHVIE